MRYFFHISYNGWHYNGWQKLPQANSVQAVLEDVLRKVLKCDINIIGCGRTDSKVHASQFFFHLDVGNEFQDSSDELIFRLNKTLPDDIVVYDIFRVSHDAHARFDVTERTYNYFIHSFKNPYLTHLSACYPFKHLDHSKLQDAARLLLNYTDYEFFTRVPDRQRTKVCHISQAYWSLNELEDRMKFTITGNRFLTGMVRILTYKMLEVANGKITLEQFEGYLTKHIKPPHILPAYPQGLYLSGVKYPYVNVPVKAAQQSELLSDPFSWKMID